MPFLRRRKTIVKAALPRDPATVEFLQLGIGCFERRQEFVDWRIHVQAPVMNIFHVPLILFVELVFVDDENPARHEIAKVRRQRRPPARLATLAYDATAIAALFAKPGSVDVAALTSPQGFAGRDGVFRFLADGVTERGLAIEQVTTGNPQIVNEAPTTFQQATN